MRRFLGLVVFLGSLAVSVAQTPPARPCPYVTAGWSLPPQGSVTSVQYDNTLQLMYVIFNSVTAHAFSNVPVQTMQAFSRSTNYLAFYNSAVVNTYHEILLAQTDNCPLLWETGAYLWSK